MITLTYCARHSKWLSNGEKISTFSITNLLKIDIIFRYVPFNRFKLHFINRYMYMYFLRRDICCINTCILRPKIIQMKKECVMYVYAFFKNKNYILWEMLKTPHWKKSPRGDDNQLLIIFLLTWHSFLSFSCSSPEQHRPP